MLGELVLTATIYAGHLRGKPMANGEIYNPRKYTVALDDRPLNSQVTICTRGRAKRRCVRAIVADRMASPRRVDLSPALARRLGIKSKEKVAVRFR